MADVVATLGVIDEPCRRLAFAAVLPKSEVDRTYPAADIESQSNGAAPCLARAISVFTRDRHF
jgi:hypothetical protein